MSAELNRRVAELSGWRMEATPNKRPLYYWTLFDPNGNPVWSALDESASIDEAWESVLHGDFASGDIVPNFSGDPAAALALLEQARGIYEATVVCRMIAGGWRVEIGVPVPSVVIDGVGGIWRRAFTGEAATFAEAAAQAWCQWKEAGE